MPTGRSPKIAAERKPYFVKLRNNRKMLAAAVIAALAVGNVLQGGQPGRVPTAPHCVWQGFGGWTETCTAAESTASSFGSGGNRQMEPPDTGAPQTMPGRS